MFFRTLIHATAGLAAVILLLVGSNTSIKSPAYGFVCAIALLIIIVYLIWVLAAIVLDGLRRPPSFDRELWDSEIDDSPYLDYAVSEPVDKQKSPVDLD
jgi:hypothetical protein